MSGLLNMEILYRISRETNGSLADKQWFQNATAVSRCNGGTSFEILTTRNSFSSVPR